MNTQVQDQLILQLTTVRDYLRWAISRMEQAGVYYGHGTDNALDEALALVFPALGIPPQARDVSLDATLSMTERGHLATLIERRVSERVPVAYLTGEAWFDGLPFYVDPRVLIPRSPIAELIDCDFAPWLQAPPGRILDLCTGSGCIGIACALVFENAEVDLSDLSADALAVAQSNIERYDLAPRVQALQSDLFQQLAGRRYDLIVSNPPYVDAGDFSSMPAEYRHEPAMALAAGEDGLELVKRILQQAAAMLNEDGVLVVEVGNSWVALEQAFADVPFTWLEFERGGHGVFLLTRQQLLDSRASLESV